jgi:hypothetical protein
MQALSTARVSSSCAGGSGWQLVVGLLGMPGKGGVSHDAKSLFWRQMDSLCRHRRHVNETCFYFNKMATRFEFMSFLTTRIPRHVAKNQFQEH